MMGGDKLLLSLPSMTITRLFFQDLPDGCLVSVPLRAPLRGQLADFRPQLSEVPLRGDVSDSRPIGGGFRGGTTEFGPIGGGPRGDVIDFSGRRPAATMTSSPQSLADSALGAEGDFSTSPDQQEFREETQSYSLVFRSRIVDNTGEYFSPAVSKMFYLKFSPISVLPSYFFFLILLEKK